MNSELDTDGTRRNRSVPETPVVTAVTRISAPVEDVWRVIVAFDQYSQWHPVLSLDAKPEQVLIGAQIPARISGGDTGELDVTMRIVDTQAPRRLRWEGGSLDAILGRHSFVLTPAGRHHRVDRLRGILRRCGRRTRADTRPARGGVRPEWRRPADACGGLSADAVDSMTNAYGLAGSQPGENWQRQMAARGVATGSFSGEPVVQPVTHELKFQRG